ncbi:proline racemase [Halorubrum persicum]|uniref:Proline racemase n=1 Tax=Halorubrum persicum TaxID=1383844 RepID=A0A2G1WES7_9EURY|nr:proline racemase family protein [Halorubrum persicum]PHQ37483.1 proline racemase [Halorubrum persicum]
MRDFDRADWESTSDDTDRDGEATDDWGWATDWEPPASWPVVETIDSHTGGEPLRIVVDGWPTIEGDTILEKRQYARDNHDHLRKALMYEPRGHADMYGAIPVEPERTDSDVGVLFTHNEGYSTMCGHGIIALATVALETEMIEPTGDESTIRMDTPAGLVTAYAITDGDGVASVAFENVPSFVYEPELAVEVPGVGEVTVAIAYGGAFYAYLPAADAGVEIKPDAVDDLICTGSAIKAAVNDEIEIGHPEDDDLGFLYGTIFTAPSNRDSIDSRNVCVFADGEVDRSPTGTGVSGRLALESYHDRLEQDEPFVVESIVGSTFTGRLRGDATVGPYDAIVPEVAGSAHLTGRSEFVIDPEDALGEGFLLR